MWGGDAGKGDPKHNKMSSLPRWGVERRSQTSVWMRRSSKSEEIYGALQGKGRPSGSVPQRKLWGSGTSQYISNTACAFFKAQKQQQQQKTTTIRAKVTGNMTGTNISVIKTICLLQSATRGRSTCPGFMFGSKVVSRVVKLCYSQFSLTWNLQLGFRRQH